jgi:hypothetical protein
MAARSVDGPTTAETVKWISGSIEALTIATAEEVLKREVAAGTFTTTPTVVTDRVVGRDYREVKPFGRIEFIARPELRVAVAWALEQIRRLSPVASGRYRDSHVVLLNGQGLTSSRLDQLDRAKPGDRVQIVNVQPYARKIEGQRANRRKQWKGRRGMSRQAPGGVYRVVYALLQQRYGRTVFVDYRLERLSIGDVEGRSSAARLRSKGGFYTYPVLQFYLKPGLH